MATATYYADKDASCITGNGLDGWSGWDRHHPVGTESGYKWRSFVHFNINFSGMVTITDATLRLYYHREAGVSHVIGGNSTTMYVSRVTSDWGEGTGSTENAWSSSQTWKWSNRASSYTTSGQASASIPGSYATNGYIDIDVTSIVNTWKGGTANYGFMLRNSDETSATDGVEFWSSEENDSGDRRPRLTITYTTNTAPNAPTNLAPTGGVVTSIAPTFTGTLSDPDAGDSLKAVDIQVSTDNTFATVTHWNASKLIASGTTFSAGYGSGVPGGTPLTGNTTYYWRARTYDAANATGAWSAAQSFKANNAPSTPTGLSPAAGSVVYTLTPTFTGSSTDPDSDDQLAYARVIVYSDAGGTTPTWDSGEFATSGSTFSKQYGVGGTLTTSLTTGTTYYWKAYTKDTNGASSATTSLQSFTTYTVGVPTGLSPNATKVNTLTPTFTATAAATMNAFEVVVYVGGVQHATSGTVAASGTAISWVYNQAALSWGTAYTYTIRSRDTLNSWSAVANGSFRTNSSPVAIPVSPLSGSVVTTLTPAFTSTYSDNDVASGFTDNPTNYTVVVKRQSDNTTMHTLVKSSSFSTNQNSVTRAAEGTALSYDVWYYWYATYTDSSGAANATGPVSANQTFKPSQVPTTSSWAAQAADLTGGLLNKPNATFTWSYSSPGAKTQYKYRVQIQTGGVTVDDSGERVSTATSYTVNYPLANSTSYTFLLDVWDTDLLQATQKSVTYTTSWTPPAAISGFMATGDEINGYALLNWEASVDANFTKYTIYRKGPYESSFSLFRTIANKPTVEAIDNETGANLNYSYYITQWALVGGVELESAASDVSIANIAAEDWLITSLDYPNLNMSIAVTDEDHGAPVEEEQFTPFGRKRKVIVRSGVYGVEGSISFYMDATERPVKESNLDQILEMGIPVYLKNPFGDYYYCYLGSPQKQYLSGGAMKVKVSFTEV